MVFDVSMWKLEERNHLVLVQGMGVKAANTMNEGDNRGRLFVINDDLTISPKHAQHLVLGANLQKRGLFSRLLGGARTAAPAAAGAASPQGGLPFLDAAGGAGGSWTEHKNIDMCGQGDVEIIPNWRGSLSLDALKRMVEERGYSAFTVSSGKPSFGHAALKKFPYQLTPQHCKPITTCCKHPCTIYIYTPPSATYNT